MNDISVRFLESYKYLKKGLKVHTPTGFANALGVSRSLITEICKKRTNAGILPIQKLVQEFPEINANWILTGEGQMVNEIASKDELVQKFNLRTDNDLSHQTIPIYNLEAAAGLVELFRDVKSSDPIDTMNIPNMPKCDGAVYVSGDSMYPLLKSGDIIMYKQISDIKNNIFWGQMYLISIDVDQEEYIMVKYLQRSEKGDDFVVLVSENRHHQDKEVRLQHIRALALIKASIRTHTMN